MSPGRSASISRRLSGRQLPSASRARRCKASWIMPRCALNTSAETPLAMASLGLGGNIGDPPAAMGEALRSLDERGDCDIVAVSRLYKTPPWGKTDQADFFNCCALIRTSLQPEALLDVCL